MTPFESSDYARMGEFMRLPCGGAAYFDESSGIGYRCDTCNAVVGSIGQPQVCREISDQYKFWKKLGGKDWDYKIEIDPDRC